MPSDRIKPPFNSRLFPVAPMVPTGVNNDFYTPPWIFERLAVRFDLDVCGPPGGVPWIPADRHYTLADDGLTAPWAGFVWLNPPFSQSTPWADRFRAHGAGVWLGPIANARWFVDLARGADRLYLCRDIAFVHPTHAGRRSSMPLASVAYGTRASEALARLAAADRVAGALVMNVPEVACA